MTLSDTELLSAQNLIFCDQKPRAKSSHQKIHLFLHKDSKNEEKIKHLFPNEPLLLCMCMQN